VHFEKDNKNVRTYEGYKNLIDIFNRYMYFVMAMNKILIPFCLFFLAGVSIAAPRNPHYKEIPYKKIVKRNIEYIRIAQDMQHPNSAWGSIGYAREGFVYVIVCDHISNSHIYEYNVKSGKLYTLGDLATHLSSRHYFERQPKVHTPLWQYSKNGLLYFATDAGDRSQYAVYDHALEGYLGAYLMTIDPKTKEVRNLGLLKKWRGAKAMLLDDKHGLLYMNVAHGSQFWKYNVNTGQLTDYGNINGNETPRTLFIDQWSNVYNCTQRGNLVRYNFEKDSIEYLDAYFQCRTQTGFSQVGYLDNGKTVVGTNVYKGDVYRYTPAKDGKADVEHVGKLDYTGSRVKTRNLLLDGNQVHLVSSVRDVVDKDTLFAQLMVFDLDKKKVVKKVPVYMSVRQIYGHPIADPKGYFYTVGFGSSITGKKDRKVYLMRYHPKKI
jgi:hypothetical protein